MAQRNVQLQCGSVTVSIGQHQWEWVDEVDYLERAIGSTDYGVTYRSKYNIAIRRRTVKFVKTETLMDQLRLLSYQAGLTGTPVTFTPDDEEPGTTWTLDWQDALEISRIIENREEITLVLQEQSPGAS